MNNNYTIVNGELYHYGVPGMRWGHKRGPKITSPQPKQTKTKTELTPEQKQAKNAKGKKIAAGVIAGVGAVTVTALAVKYAKKQKRAVQVVKKYFNDPFINKVIDSNHHLGWEKWKKEHPISSRLWG